MKRQTKGIYGFFRGAAGAAKFFDPLSTRYFGIFFENFAPPHQIFDGGTAPPINPKILGQEPQQKFLISAPAPPHKG